MFECRSENCPVFVYEQIVLLAECFFQLGNDLFFTAHDARESYFVIDDLSGKGFFRSVGIVGKNQQAGIALHDVCQHE